MTLIIKNWDNIFENAHSRKVTDLTWVRFPNKHDGSGLRRLGKMKAGAKVFTAFVLMVEIASKCPKRGVLRKDGIDLTPDEFSLKSGFPKKMFENAIPVLKTTDVDWVAEIEWNEVEADSLLCPREERSKEEKREVAGGLPASGEKPEGPPSRNEMTVIQKQANEVLK